MIINEQAEKLLELTEKGEYKSYYKHSRCIEDLSKLANALKSTIEVLNIKSDISDVCDELLADIDQAIQDLDKAESKLDAVEEELQQAADEYSEHQDYCQEIFSER